MSNQYQPKFPTPPTRYVPQYGGGGQYQQQFRNQINQNMQQYPIPQYQQPNHQILNDLNLYETELRKMQILKEIHTMKMKMNVDHDVDQREKHHTNRTLVVDDEVITNNEYVDKYEVDEMQKIKKQKKKAGLLSSYFNRKVLYTAINLQTGGATKLSKALSTKTFKISQALSALSKKKYFRKTKSYFVLNNYLKKENLDLKHPLIKQLQDEFGAFSWINDESDDCALIDMDFKTKTKRKRRRRQRNCNKSSKLDEDEDSDYYPSDDPEPKKMKVSEKTVEIDTKPMEQRMMNFMTKLMDQKLETIEKKEQNAKNKDIASGNNVENDNAKNMNLMISPMNNNNLPPLNNNNNHNHNKKSSSAKTVTKPLKGTKPSKGTKPTKPKTNIPIVKK